MLTRRFGSWSQHRWQILRRAAFSSDERAVQKLNDGNSWSAIAFATCGSPRSAYGCSWAISAYNWWSQFIADTSDASWAHENSHPECPHIRFFGMSRVLVGQRNDLIGQVPLSASYTGARFRYALARISGTRTTKVTDTSIPGVCNNNIVLSCVSSEVWIAASNERTGLMSEWIMPFSWRYARPSAIPVT